MTVELVLARNAARAEGLKAQDLGLVPKLLTIVLTCADHRTDPAHVLGLDPGDAVVLRNPGGRVTDEVVQSLVILATVAAAEGLAPRVELVVMHHTDCGLSRLAGPEHAEMLAAYAGIKPGTVAELCVDDPAQAVRYDVRRLRSLGLLSDESPVTGLVFDLASGMVERVVTL